MNSEYDAILIVGFGGPDKKEDVIPFLENVLRGRNVPHQRMMEVAEHYYQFGGVSPINAQVRELIDALRPELEQNGVTLPVYWGNRNWHPLLPVTLGEMADAGSKRVLAVVLAAYSSYSSCRQYREDIERAQAEVGPSAPQVDKVRVFYNHPDFIAANCERVRPALEQIPSERRGKTHIAFTAHSIPGSMASQCDYERQLTETCRLIAEELNVADDRWKLVYQSRSGRPTDPWLEPDICDHLVSLPEQNVKDVVVMPVGFLSDHMEVLFDLDEEAREAAGKGALNMVRAASVGTHPLFVGMLRKLIKERLSDSSDRCAVGQFGAAPDTCAADCCAAPQRPKRPPNA